MAAERTRDALAYAVRELGGDEREWLRAVWDTSPDAMALSDPDGTVLAVNPAYCALYGLSEDALVEKPFWLIFPPDKQAWAAEQYRDVFCAENPPLAFEAAVQTPSGDSRIVESRVSFLTRSGRRIAMLSVIRDITENRESALATQRLAEENAALYAQAAETLKSREAFIAMASHELRNPLAALWGLSEILQRRGTEHPELLDAIITQIRRLNRLIRNMLDFSLAESGRFMLRPAPTNLIPLIDDLVTQTQFLTRRHTIRMEAPDHPVTGNWDADRLDQVLENLLNNAVKYSPNGGEVVVRVSDDADMVRVSVADQGTGISEAAIPHLFDRFYRSPEASVSHAGGLGLGLGIAQMLVAAHGGQISVESRLGEGSTFTISLPYDAQTQEEMKPPWNA